MALKRFFVDKIEETTELSGEEFEHAKNVLRLGAGDEVILLDNSGKEYTAVIAQVEKKRMLLNVVREEAGEREASADVCLLFGYLKNADKNEFIVQKAVELGVKKIGVFSSEYSSAYMNENKLERLNKVSKEAAKQCLRSVAPEVVYFDALGKALEWAKGYENKLFAYTVNKDKTVVRGYDIDMKSARMIYIFTKPQEIRNEKFVLVAEKIEALKRAPNEQESVKELINNHLIRGNEDVACLVAYNDRA